MGTCFWKGYSLLFKWSHRFPLAEPVWPNKPGWQIFYKIPDNNIGGAVQPVEPRPGNRGRLDKDFHNRIHYRDSWNSFYQNAGEKKGNVDWKKEIKRLQHKYDQPVQETSLRIVKKLWKLKARIQGELEFNNLGSQSKLGRFKRSLDVTGVIYAIFSTRAKKIYFGRTKNSCFERFKQHCWASWSKGITTHCIAQCES